jgi:hypothetical protein
VIRPLTVPEIVIADVGMTNDSGRAGRAARQ